MSRLPVVVDQVRTSLYILLGKPQSKHSRPIYPEGTWMDSKTGLWGGWMLEVCKKRTDGE